MDSFQHQDYITKFNYCISIEDYLSGYEYYLEILNHDPSFTIDSKIKEIFSIFHKYKFDWQVYLKYNTDLLINNINDKKSATNHFIKIGHKENRIHYIYKDTGSYIKNHIKNVSNDFAESDISKNIDYQKLTDVTTIAFYLPQFHEIKENNEFWGQGFTEWTNTTKAYPLFDGHYQPKLPRDFGFYDLKNNPGIIVKQAELAKSIGIDAFCFYYYRFGDKTLMEEPIENFVNNKNINFKFCLCWANENWTKTWDGLDKDLLIKQEYEESYDSFLFDMLKYMHDHRYIKINNRPLLIIYKPNDIPNLSDRINVWNNIAITNKFDGICLMYVNGNANLPEFDGQINFCPTGESIPNVSKDIAKNKDTYLNDFIENVNLYDYVETQKKYTKHIKPKLYPCVMPSWDNSPRRKTMASVFINDTPEAYSDWLFKAYKQSKYTEHKLLFINAWNEWGEGAYLEPDLKYGFQKANCNAAVSIIRSMNIIKESDIIYNATPHKDPSPKIAYIIHGFYEDLIPELLNKIRHTKEKFDLYITLPRNIPDYIYSSILRCNLHAYFLHVDNIGRDILPWILLNKQFDFKKYDAVCKLHTKKTNYDKEYGNYVKNKSICSLIKDRETIENNIKLIRDGNSMIIPKYLKYNLKENIGSNESCIRSLCPKDIDLTNYYFGAGTMFWYDPKIINKIFDINITNSSSFQEEPIADDGTFVHAIERLFGVVVKDNNGIMIEV